ncbi:Galactoside O-acetyltransferase [Dermatophilus congolensis]|uniref:Galactoside O-acetyltransferase n=2 Tax=Dermatophilus congolensis TaxID=1863 RepID=A0AA46GZP3_9MICO|nr:Galactoside O-acetyltransferase [Dermatophilus congolensis]
MLGPMPLKSMLRSLKKERLPLLRLQARHRDACISTTVKFSGDPGQVRLGSKVTIEGPTVVNVAQGGELNGSFLEIGDRTYIGEFNNIRCAGARIVIGADCLISQHITIIGTNHGTAPGTPINTQPWVGDGVVIGDDVWIGAGAVVMPGSRIGDGAVIGAGAVVRGQIPAGWIAVGVPAAPLRQRT